jgi:hypothetical protein
MTSLLPAVVVGAVLGVVVRAPVFRPHGTVRVRSDDDPETVRAAFAGATPPMLAFQWGIADTVTTENGTATYTVSYLFGLRSADMAVHPHATTVDGNAHVELTVKTNDQEWSTYTATIRGDGDRTVVDIEYTSDRRFGLRRLPQRLVARRYRDAALEAQGYYVIERDSHIR